MREVWHGNRKIGSCLKKGGREREHVGEIIIFISSPRGACRFFFQSFCNYGCEIGDIEVPVMLSRITGI